MNWLITLFTTLLFVGAPGTDNETIRWEESRPLTWEDFRGTPRQWGTYVASTSSGISFSYSISSSSSGLDLNYTVETLFYPGSSWYNPDEVDAYILRHEQTHFDISELHARIFRKRLSQVDFDGNAEQQLSQMYEETEQARQAMQRLYDKETDHSNIREAEDRWVRYVAERLAEYERWKDPR
jgi:hypothetical protein